MPEGLLRDNIVGSLAAGRETTALAMTWSLFLIARYESAQVRMREEVLSVTNNEPVQADHVERLVWTRQTIMEALRLYPPIPLIVRECQSDTEVKGQTIPKGKLVAIPIYAIHRHRKVWNDPDAFDPERFAPGQFSEREMRFAYMPFGGGKRICLGMHFALTEAIVLIANLVRRFHFSPAEGEPVEFAVGTALHPKRPVYLNVEALR